MGEDRTTAPRSRNGGRILVDALRLHGADTVFCVPGESYLPILDALYDTPAIRVIACRHEAGAANMAEAQGKLTGRPGICLVTRGPGACHASIGVHTSFQDSTPMILLAGQVSRAHLGREAFQEIDFVRVFGGLAKWVAQIDRTDRIPEIIGEAFRVATSGRPGPVVLALPEDVLTETAEAGDSPPARAERPQPGADDLERLRLLLAEAERPLMIVGGGGWSDEACRDIAAFAEAHGLPVACSFRRQDSFPNDHPNYAGELGIAGPPALIERARRADLIVAVGARLGEMTTQGYTLLEAPMPRQRLVHVYPDAGELGRVFVPTLGIHSGTPEFATAAAALPKTDFRRRRAWLEEARGDYMASLKPMPHDAAFDPGKAMLRLRDWLPADAIVTVDAGNFSGWAQRFLCYRRPGRQLGPTSGAMGYAVPAAIAAKLTHPGRIVVACVGDGGFMMSGQELATAFQYGAAPVILVFNNGMYGTIRMHQERAYPGRVIATDLVNPDFVALARAVGAHGDVVARTADFIPAMERALAAGRAPVLELMIDPELITTRASLSAIRAKARAIRD